MSGFDANYDKALAAVREIEAQQSGGTRIKKGLPKAMIERAVKATQIYHGSHGTNLRVQQKLYESMERSIRSVAAKMSADYNSVSDQISEEAKRRGPITASPGKHF